MNIGLNIFSDNAGLSANQRIRIRPNICVRVKRTLKGPGKLTAVKNQEVAPHDILGTYKVTSGFSIINLSKELNVSPGEGAQYLQKQIGQSIFKGELLAFKKSMFSKSVITAPTDAILDDYNQATGELRLKFIPKDTSLTSGVFGIVENVDQTKGEVEIKTMVTELYGIYGSGNEKDGFLNIISGPGDLVNASKITAALKGQIVVAGALVLGETLKQAFSMGLKGLICGGLNLDEYLSLAGSLYPNRRLGSEVGISVIGTEGFGLIPISSDIFNLLQQKNGKFVFISGNISRLLLPSEDADSILTLRKISLPVSNLPEIQPDLNLSQIKLGSKVRLIWPPFMGLQGVVEAIDKTPTKLESGISTFMLTVNTSSKKIKVAFTNVELI